MEASPPTTVDPYILYLLAEKDRLVGEKDELVDSKDRLWRGYHEIIREKDAENEQLRQKNRDLTVENERIKEKAQELAEALRELIEKDAASEEYEEGDQEEWDLASEYRNKLFNDSGTPWGISDPNLLDERPPEELLDGLVTTSRPSPAPSGISDTPTETLIRKDFAFALLIDTSADGDDMMVGIRDMATAVHKSMKTTLKTIGKRHARKKIPAHPTTLISCCAYLWATDCVSSRRWTVDHPRKHACYSCVHNKRACLLWIGQMRWLVLPLPPELRPTGCTYTDPEFFIFSGENAMAYSYLWEVSKDKRQKDNRRKLADVKNR